MFPGLSVLNLTRCFPLLTGFLFLEDLGYDSDEMRSKLLPNDPMIKRFLGSFSIPIDWHEMWRIHVEDQEFAQRMMQAVLKSWMPAEYQFLRDCHIASVLILGEMKRDPDESVTGYIPRINLSEWHTVFNIYR